MLSCWSIKYKLIIGVTVLSLVVVVLFVSGLLGVSSYRGLVRAVSQRAAELPLADDLTRNIAELRICLTHIRPAPDIGSQPSHGFAVRTLFDDNLVRVRLALQRYREQLELAAPQGTGIEDAREEREAVQQIERTIERVWELHRNEHWVFDPVAVANTKEELDHLAHLASDLPSHLQHRMQALKGNARGEYHALIASTWTTGVLSTVGLIVLGTLFYAWVIRPLNVLIKGSRRVAQGEFDYRIQLHSQDEMAELANAMNLMTQKFCEIRDDLDQQVKERTQQVVRSEQLASVGFLAAGVAHEINNPLQSIAMCAEGLERRLAELLAAPEPAVAQPAVDAAPHRGSTPLNSDDAAVIRKYLGRIQSEAFRCRGITEKLLDFSRIGDVKRQPVELRALIDDVVEMVRTIGKYKQDRKQVRCRAQGPVFANANGQEIKQVMVNLLTNALDCLDADGVVDVELTTRNGEASIVVRDNGCGMTDEVRQHLFEPFFTRRREGKGTGLGLSISYRIVVDHGGSLTAHSDGPGRGARFEMRLPLAAEQQLERTTRAA